MRAAIHLAPGASRPIAVIPANGRFGPLERGSSVVRVYVPKSLDSRFRGNDESLSKRHSSMGRFSIGISQCSHWRTAQNAGLVGDGKDSGWTFAPGPCQYWSLLVSNGQYWLGAVDGNRRQTERVSGMGQT